MPLIRRLLLALLLLPTLAAAAQDGGGPADLSLFVFSGDLPAADVGVEVDGQPRARTNDNGAAWLLVPAGQRTITLYRGDGRRTDVQLDIAEGENVRVIATLPKAPSGGQAVVDVQSSKGTDAIETMAAGGMKGPKGTLSGQVVSAKDGGPVAGARVFVSGTPVDVKTDRKGRFEARLPAGTYAVSVIHGDFSTQTRDGLEVAAGETTTTEVELTPAGLELEDYVVTVPYIEGSVASAISEQRETSSVSEVMGAEQMSRSGDSDAAEALQRVTGLTIEDGKYVVIRGQPSRYTLTLWNNSPLPSPDPIRRVVPLDMFPTGVLKQVQVQKTYSPDKPGSFGGGLVDLQTRGVPEDPFGELSLSTGMNTQSLGQSAPTYDGGSRDWLGEDDGTRALPGPVEDATNGGSTSLSSLSQSEQDALGKTFPNNYQVTERTLPPDVGLSTSGGTSVDTPVGDYGFLGSFTYGRKFRYREEIQRDYAASNQGLSLRNDFNVRRNDMDVELGGMMVLGGQWENSKVTSNTFFIRKTTKRTEVKEGTRVVSDDLFIRKYTLSFNQRDLFAEQLKGKHELGPVTFRWRGMTAEGTRKSPDRRTYTYVRAPNGEWLFYEPVGARRRYNTVTDKTNSLGADLAWNFADNEVLESDLSVGYAFFKKDRESQTQRFTFLPNGSADLTPDNPEVVLDPSHIGDTIDFSEQTQSNDDYKGHAKVRGSYVRADARLWDTLRLVGGVRRETADFAVHTFQGSGVSKTAVEGGFTDSHLLPALTATWFMTDNMQLRAAYSRTVSRPMLNELSPATYYDPETGEEYQGNPDLTSAKLRNLDLRWEWYPADAESLTAGVFHKSFQDPIERSFIQRGTNTALNTVQNAESATVQGAELGFRTGLHWVADWLGKYYLQGNAAFIDSQVTLSDQGIATNKDRPLQGQAPYIFNLQGGYDGEVNDATLSFTYVGKRLYQAGIQTQPDVYLQELPYLDFTFITRPWEHWELKFEASNLLDPQHLYTQGGKLYRSYYKGRDFSLSAKWKF